MMDRAHDLKRQIAMLEAEVDSLLARQDAGMPAARAHPQIAAIEHEIARLRRNLERERAA
jgi:hypothetical protein